MTLTELKQSISEYQYIEHDEVIDFSCAMIIANILKLGDPFWGIIIGASSGGKSQILRPFVMVNPKIIHRVDDLTENTLLSGMKVGKDMPDPSLLTRIGQKGILIISDITVLFSKNKESRAAILSQFRMVYDGELTKYIGTTGQPLTWKGYIGVIAAGTTSTYERLEEVSEMGERFMCWRLRDYDAKKATTLAMGRKIFGAELDNIIGEFYRDYIKDTVEYWDNLGAPEIVIPDHIKACIMRIALFAEDARTMAPMDFMKREIIRHPVPAMPMRTSLQLTALAKALYIMRKGELGNIDERIINWCGYSLINEEKRAILRVVASVEYDHDIRTQTVADKIGLATSVVGHILQNLAAVKVLTRTGDVSGLRWRFRNVEDWKLVRTIECITQNDTDTEERDISAEEENERDKVLDMAFEQM